MRTKVVINLYSLKQRKLLTVLEASKLIGSSRQKVYNELWAGRLPFTRPRPNSILIERTDLMRWLLVYGKRYNNPYIYVETEKTTA
jgi:excisionase family DNA binding protein